MIYLKTTMGTTWGKVEEPKGLKGIINNIISFYFPKGSRYYEENKHLIKFWLIEFLEDSKGNFYPWREIGLDRNEKPIFYGPNKKSHGFWGDTNKKYQDFTGQLIDKEEFERIWEIIETAETKEENET